MRRGRGGGGTFAHCDIRDAISAGGMLRGTERVGFLRISLNFSRHAITG